MTTRSPRIAKKLHRRWLAECASDAVQRFRLRYSATVVDAKYAEPWLSENGCVVFKFWATDFPMVSFFSGNNPASR